MAKSCVCLWNRSETRLLFTPVHHRSAWDWWKRCNPSAFSARECFITKAGHDTRLEDPQSNDYRDELGLAEVSLWFPAKLFGPLVAVEDGEPVAKDTNTCDVVLFDTNLSWLMRCWNMAVAHHRWAKRKTEKLPTGRLLNHLGLCSGMRTHNIQSGQSYLLNKRMSGNTLGQILPSWIAHNSTGSAQRDWTAHLFVLRELRTVNLKEINSVKCGFCGNMLTWINHTHKTAAVRKGLIGLPQLEPRYRKRNSIKKCPVRKMTKNLSSMVNIVHS